MTFSSSSATHRFAMQAPGYWLLLVTGAFFICCLWKIGSSSSWSSNLHALIHFDLSIPSSSSSTSRRPPFNRTNTRLSRDVAHRRKHWGTRYMLQLYHRRPDADVVRAIQPRHISGPLSDGGRILEFAIPSVGVDETLETAELLGIDGTIIRVRSLDGPSATRNGSEEIRRSRKDDAWRAFDITSTVAGKSGNVVKLYVHGRLTYHLSGDSPMLLLNYTKAQGVRRRRRSAAEEQESQDRWENELRRRRRNSCQRRSMYVDFALIEFDNWVIAPPGYEAYQCSGRCTFPMGDHLSPSMHAIVQTLMHRAFQSSDGSKVVTRACCVPTELESISMLYVLNGTVTYKHDYKDMVVVECGCR